MIRRTAVALILALAISAVPLQAGGGRFWPDKERWRDALLTAARDPLTWVPAAGATVIGIGGWDSSISNWAIRETPVFGSSSNALNWSDNLRTASHLVLLGTMFTVHEPEKPWKKGARRFVVQHVAAITTTTLTSGLKTAADRDRPDGSDRESFPSGHSSRAFSYAASGRRNLRDSRLPRGLRTGIGIGLVTLAGGTAWARVEGGKHYPTDVLVGAALGNFVSVVINEAFLGAEPDIQVGVRLDRGESQLMIMARW